jgi:hypothetical protein
MPAWVPHVETGIYRVLAKLAARSLGALPSVRSIYTRRSVACGEVVFGHSDIDLHAIIEPPPSLHAEAEFLRQFADRFAALKRLIACLGDCDVSTPAELESWYRLRPYTVYRDRAWLRLFGEAYERPVAANGAGDDSLLWWFFWAWERLPEFYRSGNVRTCCNLFIDMVNAYGVYVGAFRKPKSRAEVLHHWRAAGPPSEQRNEIWRAFRNGFRGAPRALKRSIYLESLQLCEVAAAQGAARIEDDLGATEVCCQVPFSFSERRYLLVNLQKREQVERALDTMQRDVTVFVTTAPALKLYLYQRNPWEYYALRRPPRERGSFSPPPAALRRAMVICLNKERPRAAGFSVGRRHGHCAAIGRQYAQYRLQVDHGIVAASAAELPRQYQACYGRWPYTGTSSRATYFERDYRVLCETIDGITRRLGLASPAERR